MKENKEQKKENKTGRYVYDKKTGKVVKISDEIVGVKKGSTKKNENSCGFGGCSCCGN